MASMIQRHPEAFAMGATKGRKKPRREDSAHLKFIRELPCLVSGEFPVHAAHIRYKAPEHGKRETGMQEKPDDRWTVPLAARLHTDGHEAQHKAGERAWWAERGIDPCSVALALWGISGDHDAARIILRVAREKAALYRSAHVEQGR